MAFDKSIYLVNSTNKKLYSLLKEVYDYEEYIFGIMDYCETDEMQLKMIEVIESGVTDISEISLWAISIYRGRDINELKAKYLN